MAGADIFAGEGNCSTPNPDVQDDKAMFDILGLTPRKAFKELEVEQ
ncbi:MAG: hypothetical protein R2794_12210 [Chitinophagales bacterium]